MSLAEVDRQIAVVQYVFAKASHDWVIPNIKDFLLDELVNGTIAYSGGTVDTRFKNSFGMFCSFEDDIWKSFEKNVKRDKLPPTVYSSIAQLVTPYTVNGYHNESGSAVELYRFVSAGASVLPESMNSAVRMSSEQIDHYLSKGRKFVADERNTLDGIAIAMQPLIKEDLQVIYDEHL